MGRKVMMLWIIVSGWGMLFADGTQPPGSGTSESPYQVSTLDHLLWISTNSGSWTSYFEQTANIDASATSTWNGGSGWLPIGLFSGVYNGQGHSISGISISRSATSYQGFFGQCDDSAIIQNLGVTGVDITGASFVGALVGSASSTISNCYSTGSVNGESGGHVGGLIGKLRGSVSFSYSTCTTHNAASNAGGLIGTNERGTVTNCFSEGNVSGENVRVGGLVGYNLGSLSNCYSLGSVTRTSGSSTEYGGLIGYNNSEGDVEYCYSTGTVNCGSSINLGFIGNNAGTCTACFFDSQTSGHSSSAGATAYTTAQMKDHTNFTASGWDFEAETANGTNDYWDMDYTASINNGYPFLSWQNGGDTSLPVDLAAFSARCEGCSVVLEWTTESQTDNLGFILERKDANTDWMTIASWRTDDALKGQGNCSCATDYSFVDEDVEPETTYSYRLSDVSTVGDVNIYAALSITVDALPLATAMMKAFPNPFNPETYISYRLAEDTEAEIAVFDLLGRQVQMLFGGMQSAGSYHVYWNGKDATGSRMPSGTYVIRLKTKQTVQVQKVVLMK